MKTRGVRTYPVPELARTGLLATAATASLDVLETAAQAGNGWASKIVHGENQRFLAGFLGESPVLPVGVLAAGTDDIVVALHRDGRSWSGTGWEPTSGRFDAMPLMADDVAFVARAFSEGADAVVMRPVMPLAFIAAAEDAPAAPSVSVPEGGKPVAVVDELDRNAVMDLVLILPGPKVMRRHDGEWRDDDKWLSILRSVKPPPIVTLDESMLASVVQQVDSQTAGQDWEETDLDEYMNASAARVDEMALEFALIASKAASKASPAGTTPSALRKYWTVGPGAAKIRWGTPGAWRRCRKYLSKYVGPHRAAGQCTNLAKALGGHGVATHVGS